jgi:hypothetical protein
MLLTSLAIVGCGSDSSSNQSDGDGTRGDGTSTVALFLADGPTDEFDQIWIELSQISLLPEGDADPVVIYETADPQRIDLLTLREDDLLLAVNSAVPAGTYHKIRLMVECVEGQQAGQPVELRLSSGKIDLNPQGPIDVKPGETLSLRLDIDAEKSIHIAGSHYNFRPVVFAQSSPLYDKRPCHHLIKGEITQLLYSDEESQTVSGFQMAPFGAHASLEVYLEDDVVIFDDAGQLTGPDALAAEQTVSIKGKLDTDARLLAETVIIGEVRTLTGVVQSAVDGQNHFLVDPGFYEDDPMFRSDIAPENDVTTVALSDGTIIRLDGESVNADRIQPGLQTRIVGKVGKESNIMNAIAVFLKAQKMVGILTKIERAEGGSLLTLRAAMRYPHDIRPHKDPNETPDEDTNEDPGEFPGMDEDPIDDPSVLPDMDEDPNEDPRDLPGMDEEPIDDPSVLPDMDEDPNEDPSDLPGMDEDPIDDPSVLPDLDEDLNEGPRKDPAARATVEACYVEMEMTLFLPDSASLSIKGGAELTLEQLTTLVACEAPRVQLQIEGGSQSDSPLQAGALVVWPKSVKWVVAEVDPETRTITALNGATLQVPEDTPIWLSTIDEQEPIELDAIEAHDLLHVVALKSCEPTDYSAVQIVKMPGCKPPEETCRPRHSRVEFTVAKLGDNTIIGDNETTIAVTDETVYVDMTQHPKQEMAFDDIAVGDTLVCHILSGCDDQPDRALMVFKIDLEKDWVEPKPDECTAKIYRMRAVVETVADGVIQTADGRTIEVPAGTPVYEKTKGGFEELTLDDLEPEEIVEIKAIESCEKDGLTALMIIRHTP